MWTRRKIMGEPRRPINYDTLPCSHRLLATVAHHPLDTGYTVRMPAASSTTLTIDGVTLTVVVERKPIKNVNARLRDTTLSVSAPLAMPQATLDPIITEAARKLLRRVHAKTVNAEESAIKLAQRVAARFPKPTTVAQVLFVTTQTSRWGSYSSATHTIRLHAALRQMPRWVLEAVVAHELAHVTHHDHGPDFWALVRRVSPDTDRANAFLAGVSWFGQQWEHLPPIERALLTSGLPHDTEHHPS